MTDLNLNEMNEVHGGHGHIWDGKYILEGEITIAKGDPTPPSE